MFATSTWRRHRPAVAEPLPVETQGAFVIDVLNGNGRKGEARAVASLLRSEGFVVETISNAERFDYPRTLVIDRAGDDARARAVAAALGGVPVVLQRRTAGSPELTVVLGHDWSHEARWEER